MSEMKSTKNRDIPVKEFADLLTPYEQDYLASHPTGRTRRGRTNLFIQFMRFLWIDARITIMLLKSHN
jgi:hypothetical protein